MKKIDKSYDDIKTRFNFYGRDDFYNNLRNDINQFDEGMNIALNGSWGSGKTIFVKKLIDDLDNLPDTFGHYFNAWEYDYFETPIYAFIHSLLENEEFKAVYETSIESDPKLQISMSFGTQLFSIKPKMEPHEHEKILSKIEYSKTTLKLVNSLISNYLKTKNKKLIIVIDELDRCNPSFAVALLEQLKHIINKDVLFIYAINSLELENNIRDYYGNSYDVSNYLHKIFDYSYSLPNLSLNKIYTYLKQIEPEINYIKFDYNVVYDAMIINDVTFRDLNRLQKFVLKISNFIEQEESEQYNKVFNTTLLILSIIKVKNQNLIRECIKNQIVLDEIKLAISKIESFSKMINDAQNNDSDVDYDTDKLFRKIFSANHLINLLY